MAEGVALKRVPIEEKPLLWKLLQEYLNLEPFRGAHHFKDEEGNWKYPYFDGYWTEPVRHPFFIYYHDELVGFIMFRELIPNELCSVAEINVNKEFWRKGIATEAMRQLQLLFPYNRWKISYLTQNANRAGLFWKHWVSICGCEVELEEVDE